MNFSREKETLAPARPLRIGLVAVDAANHQQSWRGVLRSLRRELERQGAYVEEIHIGDGAIGTLFRMKEFFIRRIVGRRYQRHRELLVRKYYGRTMDAAIVRERLDLAIVLKTYPVSQSRSAKPIILYNDAPFSGFIGFYEEFTGMSDAHVAQGHAMEYESARKAALSVYTSQWAADLAMRDYGIAPDRIAVVPIGANIDAEPSDDAIETMLASRKAAAVREFFWLGVDWQRKRGDLAVAIVGELRARGHDVHMTAAGAGAMPPDDLPPFVTWHPFMRGPEIEAHLAKTHFLLLPTLADCTPVVYSEANAFAVPVLSTDVGGIASSVEDGVNGLLFGAGDAVAAWADRIEPYLQSNGEYERFARTSLQRYREVLNWRVAVKTILPLARKLTTAD